MGGFILRTARPDDEAAVTGLLEASYGQLLPAAYDRALLDDVLPIIARANPRLLASGAYSLALTVDGAVIGAGGWSREYPDIRRTEPDTGHIRHFATHPDWTGRGVGRSICQRCLEESRSAGLRRLECYSSLNAVDFYARLGFLKVRSVDIPMGGDLVMPSTLMERVL